MAVSCSISWNAVPDRRSVCSSPSPSRQPHAHCKPGSAAEVVVVAIADGGRTVVGRIAPRYCGTSSAAAQTFELLGWQLRNELKKNPTCINVAEIGLSTAIGDVSGVNGRASGCS